MNVHCGHGPVAPQQIEPQASPPAGPAASQVSPVPHAEPAPHMQTPKSQRSPAPQQIAPQPTPVVHVSFGWHSVAGSASAGAWHGRAVHVKPVRLHVQSLQSSPAGQV